MEITPYEVVAHKVGRLLYPQETQTMDPVELNAPLIRMKIKSQWEDWEANHPEMGRAGYMANPTKLYSREIMEGELERRKEWFKNVAGSLKIYAESPQELRINPSYCPYERRYTWEEYKKLQERQPHVLNFPKIPSPSPKDELNEKWFVMQCKDTLKLYQQIPDFNCQILCKIVRISLQPLQVSRMLS